MTWLGYLRAMRVKELDHIVLDVADVERSLAWYCDRLGLAPDRVDEWRRGEAPFPSVRIHDGCVIDLFAQAPSGENMNHVCLVVDRRDLDDIVADGGFEVLEGPVPRWGARGNGTSVYVLDPDGNTVELRSYD
jgi:catechol 2,3-dioxygenase-like lactoylglutathione lyase family enzyme